MAYSTVCPFAGAATGLMLMLLCVTALVDSGADTAAPVSLPLPLSFPPGGFLPPLVGVSQDIATIPISAVNAKANTLFVANNLIVCFMFYTPLLSGLYMKKPPEDLQTTLFQRKYVFEAKF
jgi:hypothetical protein